jgi:hypothetical protein
MTFIEMLQQGGYILPQYSSGQQTYSAPAAGMQTLQTMMQVDQGAQNRYLQGEQLNLYKSQNTQNIINSTIQNQLNRKTQERLQKQMNLSNQKLEFDMQKAILKDIDEEREKLNSSFLLRDRLQIEKELTDQGLDEAGIIAGMKGDLSFDNYSKFQLKRESIIAKQKNGFTNMHTYNQASKLVEKTDAELKRAYELMKVGALNYNAFEKYLQNSKEAATELIKFENGDVQNIDFKDSKWSGIIGATDFLDEIALKDKIDMQASVNKQKLQNEMLETDVLNNKLKLEQKLQPFEVFTKMTDAYQKFGETSNVYSTLATHFPGVDFNNPDAFMQAFQAAPVVVQDSMREALKKDVAKEDNIKTIENLLVEAVKSGDQSRIDQATKLFQMSKQTSHSVTSDIDGNPVVKEGSLNVYPEKGIKKTTSGNLKELHVTLPGINPNIQVETTGTTNKGKAKIVTPGGKTYYQDVYIDEEGNHFLKITSSDVMAALMGKADGMIWDDTGMGSWIGINELKDYDDIKAGDAYIGNHGGKYNEEMKAILIPTTPYGDAQINTNTSTGTSNKAAALPD